MTGQAKRNLWRIFAITCGVLGTLIAFGPPATAQGNAAPPAPSVTVAPVISRPVASTLEFVGRTDAYREVDLRARVVGFLLERFFEEGAEVSQGQVLFQIDPAEYEAAAAAAAARIKRAEATLTEATRNLKRAETLVKRGHLSQAELDEAVAKAAQAEADLAGAKADLTTAELNLGYTRIVAPISGRIGKSRIDAGNLIGPDSGVLASIVDVDPIRVTFAITEREMLDYKQAQQGSESRRYTPTLRLANGSMLEEPGVITFLDNRADPMTGTIRLFAEFPNAEQLVLPGQFVSVVLVSAEPEEMIVVPQSAVQTNQAGAFVLVVDEDNSVSSRAVVLGERTDGDVVVTQGLVVGEMVVVEGIQKVRPGAKVTPVPAAQEPAS
ncbi:MAG: efflux RND transporter periplasmic adaptor subunit [Rhodospirillales bacterium]|nr:MAG: efflux RND transporter periplasmic adaptor subunit [Rhodospirillales bacterium]